MVLALGPTFVSRIAMAAIKNWWKIIRLIGTSWLIRDPPEIRTRMAIALGSILVLSAFRKLIMAWMARRRGCSTQWEIVVVGISKLWTIWKRAAKYSVRKVLAISTKFTTDSINPPSKLKSSRQWRRIWRGMTPCTKTPSPKPNFEVKLVRLLCIWVGLPRNTRTPKDNTKSTTAQTTRWWAICRSSIWTNNVYQKEIKRRTKWGRRGLSWWWLRKSTPASWKNKKSIIRNPWCERWWRGSRRKRTCSRKNKKTSTAT